MSKGFISQNKMKLPARRGEHSQNPWLPRYVNNLMPGFCSQRCSCVCPAIGMHSLSVCCTILIPLWMPTIGLWLGGHVVLKLFCFRLYEPHITLTAPVAWRYNKISFIGFKMNKWLQKWHQGEFTPVSSTADSFFVFFGWSAYLREVIQGQTERAFQTDIPTVGYRFFQIMT